MTTVDTTLPILILQLRILDHGTVGIDAVTAYGRTLTATVPRWNTTADGITEALRESWLAQLAADDVLLAVQASWAADERDDNAVDDSDTDATVG
jgi:hypothetical protein